MSRDMNQISGVTVHGAWGNTYTDYPHTEQDRDVIEALLSHYKYSLPI